MGRGKSPATPSLGNRTQDCPGPHLSRAGKAGVLPPKHPCPTPHPGVGGPGAFVSPPLCGVGDGMSESTVPLTEGWRCMASHATLQSWGVSSSNRAQTEVGVWRTGGSTHSGSTRLLLLPALEGAPAERLWGEWAGAGAEGPQKADVTNFSSAPASLRQAGTSQSGRISWGARPLGGRGTPSSPQLGDVCKGSDGSSGDPGWGGWSSLGSPLSP